jgi:hypothetical protein
MDLLGLHSHCDFFGGIVSQKYYPDITISYRRDVLATGVDSFRTASLSPNDAKFKRHCHIDTLIDRPGRIRYSDDDVKKFRPSLAYPIGPS